MVNICLKLAAAATVETSLLMLAAVGVGQAATIVNGSFENGDFNTSNNSWVRLSPGSTKITNWIVGGLGGVDWHNTTEMKFPFGGEFVVDLNLNGGDISQTGTLSQTFATIPSQLYTLSFYLSGPTLNNISLSNPRQVMVDIAGIQQLFSTPESLHTNLVWEQHQLTFEAIDTETTLTFSSVNGSGFWGPVLDNVSIEEVTSVPEPITGLVVAAGLGSAALKRAKDKSKKS